jgi:hypothetical protein
MPPQKAEIGLSGDPGNRRDRRFFVRVYPLNLRQKYPQSADPRFYCGGAIRLLRSSLATTPSLIWTTR